MSEWIRDHPDFALAAILAFVGFLHWLQRIWSRTQHLETREAILTAVSQKYATSERLQLELRLLQEHVDAVDRRVSDNIADVNRRVNEHVSRCHDRD